MTRVEKINDDYTIEQLRNHEAIQEATNIILSGELVSFPTETVYGLGANGLDEKACKKIFEVKGRPQDNPLILHIHSYEMLQSLITEEEWQKVNTLKPFLEVCWPGPLTIVLKRSSKVPDRITAGGPTVAIRMPNHPIALSIIEKTNVPIAAPSANRSGKPSPTNAQDVFEDLDGLLPLIIDGGECNIGIESTVLDLSESKPQILRPGFYTREFIKDYLPDIEYDHAILNSGEIPKSPGQKYRHYAPKAELKVYVGHTETVDSKIKEQLDLLDEKIQKIGILAFEENQLNEYIATFQANTGKDIYLIKQGSKANLQMMSHDLFKNLRALDRYGVDLILAVGVEETAGFGVSIMNRLRKSASNQVFNLSENDGKIV